VQQGFRVQGCHVLVGTRQGTPRPVCETGGGVHLRDGERVVQVAQGVELPLLPLHRHEELLDALQHEQSGRQLLGFRVFVSCMRCRLQPMNSADMDALPGNWHTTVKPLTTDKADPAHQHARVCACPAATAAAVQTVPMGKQ